MKKCFFSKNKISVLILTGILLICGLFSSCENYENTPSVPTVSIPKTTQVPAPTLDPDIFNPASGGTLTVGATYADSLSPLFTGSEEVKYCLSLIYDTFIKISPDGEVVPGLAEKWEKDNLTYHFTLKKGIKWHDGSELKGADVLNTLNYIHARGGLYINIMDNVQSYWAQGDYDIYFKLKEPDFYFLKKLNFPVVKDGEDGRFLGTGPFMFLSEDESSVTYTKNSMYYGEESYYDNVKICFFNTEREKYNSDCDILFFKGETMSDYSEKSGSVTYKYSGRTHICLIPNLAERFSEYDYYTGAFLYNEKNIVGTKKGRQAISYCIDRQKLAETVSRGNADVKNAPVIDIFSSTFDQNDYYGKDLEKAHTLFKSLGYYRDETTDKWYYDKELTHPVLIDFYVVKDTVYSEIIACLTEDFESAGLSVAVYYVRAETLVKYFNLKTYSFTLMTFEEGNAQELEEILGEGGAYNFNYYKNDEMEMLFTLLRTAGSEYEAGEIVRRISEIINDELPVIGLYTVKEGIRFSENVLDHDKSFHYIYDPIGDVTLMNERKKIQGVK